MNWRGQPSYLKPYLAAASRYGDGFGTLLWASTTTQEARFDAIERLCGMKGKSITDVGCGRADLVDYLFARGIHLEHYTGLEAVDALATAAARKHHSNMLIIRCDFVAEPARLFTGSDAIVFSGSLNTLEPEVFYKTIRYAHQATVESVVFNFLSSPRLAAAEYLHWYPPEHILQFARDFGGEVTMLDDYLDGDCTIHIRKPVDH